MTTTVELCNLVTPRRRHHHHRRRRRVGHAGRQWRLHWRRATRRRDAPLFRRQSHGCRGPSSTITVHVTVTAPPPATAPPRRNHDSLRPARRATAPGWPPPRQIICICLGLGLGIQVHVDELEFIIHYEFIYMCIHIYEIMVPSEPNLCMNSHEYMDSGYSCECVNQLEPFDFPNPESNERLHLTTILFWIY